MRDGTRLGLDVDPIMCRGHGLCAELLPEHVLLDEWGYPHLASRAVPPSLRAQARAAASACPTLALRLRRLEGENRSS
jgi:ferredoxin